MLYRVALPSPRHGAGETYPSWHSMVLYNSPYCLHSQPRSGSVAKGGPVLGSLLMPHGSLGSLFRCSHSRDWGGVGVTSTMRSENTRDVLWSGEFRGPRRTDALGLSLTAEILVLQAPGPAKRRIWFFQNNKQAREQPNRDSEHKYMVLIFTQNCSPVRILKWLHTFEICS